MPAKVFFILILTIAFLLRTIFLGDIPSGLHYSEAEIGWRAQNLINFAKDEYGRNLPLIFSSWKNLELPVPTYITVPFVALSESSIFFLRLPFALAGFLAVLGTIYLTRILFPQKKNLDLLAGFILAISPWGVWLSRVVSSEIISFTFFIWGAVFILRSDLKLTLNTGKKYYLGLFFLILSIFSSVIAVFFLIPLLLSVAIYQVKIKKINTKVSKTIVLTLIAAVIAGALVIRQTDFSLLTNQNWVDNINTLRGQNSSENLGKLGSIFFNKSYLLIILLDNFFSHYSLSFLFARGDGNGFHNPSNFGPFLVILLPAFLLGLYRFFQERSQQFVIILLWCFCAVIPVLFESNYPNTAKFIFALYPFSLIIAWGLLKLDKRLLTVFIFLFFYNLSIVIYDVIEKEPLRTDQIWNPNTLKIAQFLKNNPDKKIRLTDKIDTNPAPTIAFLNNIPYYETNIGKMPFIPNTWINQVQNVEIGNFQKISKYNEFDIYIVSEEEKKNLKCLNVKSFTSEKENKIYILEKCI